MFPSCFGRHDTRALATEYSENTADTVNEWVRVNADNTGQKKGGGGSEYKLCSNTPDLAKTSNSLYLIMRYKKGVM